MLPMDKNMHLLGGEYLQMDEPELSATGIDHALKHARGNTPTTNMSSAKGMNLAHTYRQAAIPQCTTLQLESSRGYHSAAHMQRGRGNLRV